MDNDYFWFSRRRTKKVEGGIKARAARFGESWWSARWLESLHTNSGCLSRGRNYARRGQIMDFEVIAGCIRGKIQGSADEPYTAQILFPALSAELRDCIEKEMRSRPAFAAQLLNRELPQDLDSTFLKYGAPLF